MPTPFIGEIRMFAGRFAPDGWLFCDGQLLQISEYEPLHGLLGTTYGGDGQETFGLPNLQSRIPIGQGQGPGLSNRTLAQTVGVEEVTLTVEQIPPHTHAFIASTNPGGATNPAGQVLAAGTNVKLFRSIASNIPMSPEAIAPYGGSKPHENRMKYLVVNFILATEGIYPVFP